MVSAINMPFFDKPTRALSFLQRRQQQQGKDMGQAPSSPAMTAPSPSAPLASPRKALPIPQTSSPSPLPSRPDDKHHLPGRIVHIEVEMRGSEKTKGREGGGRSWLAKCTNAKALRKTAQPPDHVYVPGTEQKDINNALLYMQKELKLDPGLKLDFRHDLVFLKGYAHLNLVKDVPGLPFRLKAFLGLFRCQLVGPEEFGLASRGLRSKFAGAATPDYHDLLFPQRIGRQVVICLNWDQEQANIDRSRLRRVEYAGRDSPIHQRSFTPLKRSFETLQKLCVRQEATGDYECTAVILTQ